jgi:hypothetical protein
MPPRLAVDGAQQCRRDEARCGVGTAGIGDICLRLRRRNEVALSAKGTMEQVSNSIIVGWRDEYLESPI